MYSEGEKPIPAKKGNQGSEGSRCAALFFLLRRKRLSRAAIQLSPAAVGYFFD